MTTPVPPEDPLIPATGRTDAAYREGRVDERDRLRGATTATVDQAYVRGRRDERSRRRGSPLMTIILLVVVLIGGALIYLAIQNGSFQNGGAVVDQKISNAAETVKAPLRGAADSAGNALQNAGSNLKQTAGADKP